MNDVMIVEEVNDAELFASNDNFRSLRSNINSMSGTTVGPIKQSLLDDAKLKLTTTNSLIDAKHTQRLGGFLAKDRKTSLNGGAAPLSFNSSISTSQK